MIPKLGSTGAKKKFRAQVTEDRNRNTELPFTDVDEFALCCLLSSWVKIRNTPINRRLICYLSLAALFFGSACWAKKTDERTKVRLKTNKGDIVIQLDAEKSPVTVANFKKYVSAGHYNGTVFHRIIDGFMIQGGGFANEDGKLMEKKTDKAIVNESQNGLKNEIGTIAMARTSDPNSATAQFFINVANNESLNFPSHDGYAVFGKVIEGMDVVNQIKTVKTGIKELYNLESLSGKIIPALSKDVPVEPIMIEAATLE